MNFINQRLLLATLGVVTLMPAQAGTVFSGNAQLSNLAISVVDLRPDDGIVASIQATSPHGLVAETSWLGHNTDGWTPNTTVLQAASVKRPASKSIFDGSPIEIELSSGQGSVSRSNNTLMAKLEVDSASVNDPLLTGNGTELSSRFEVITGSWSLRPGTEVHVTGQLDASTQWDLSGLNTTISKYAGSSTAYIYFDSIGPASAGSFDGPVPNRAVVFTELYSNTNWSPVTNEVDSRSFELVFRNLGTTDMQVSSGFFVSSSLNVTGVVPEPSTWAMGLVGLACLAARRVRQRDAVPTV